MSSNTNFNEEHSACKYYFSESHTSFILKDIQPNEKFELGNLEFNNIIVILRGKLLIEYNEYTDNTFGADEIVFIPAYAKSNIVALENSKILVGTFEIPNDVCSSRLMDSLWQMKSKMEFTFSSIPVVPQMKQFMNLLVMYLESGVNCAHLHEIKQKELFLVLKWFYSKEDYIKLLYPVIGKSLDFRTLVLKNYNTTRTIAELAAMIGMSRSKFDTKFKEVFGVPAKQWMLKRKAQSVKFYLSKPNVTISDAMIKYEFDSFTHFNRFCKQQFQHTPTELIKILRNGEDEK